MVFYDITWYITHKTETVKQFSEESILKAEASLSSVITGDINMKSE